MGEARNHTQRFLRQHPTCIFCGGSEPATTIEHCPPKCLFKGRHWPEGFEFPSCAQCNNSTTAQDALVALLARVNPFDGGSDIDGGLRKLHYQVQRDYPTLFRRMLFSPIEARQKNRELGVSPLPGETHQQTGLVRITQEHNDAIITLARKLAKGVYYQSAGISFPNDGCMAMSWFSNAELLCTGRFAAFDALEGLNGISPVLKRSGQHLNDQFVFKLSMTEEKHMFVIQAMFGYSFGFVVMGSTEPGLLESIIKDLSKRTGDVCPFIML